MLRKHFKRLVSRQYEKMGLNGYDYDFSFDYDATAVDDILDIHKCLMKRNNIFTIIVGCIFEEDDKFYPQLYLDDCLYEFRV